MKTDLTTIAAKSNNRFKFYINEFVSEIDNARILADKIMYKMIAKDPSKIGCNRPFCTYEDFKNEAK